MNQFILRKKLNVKAFEKYIASAQENNQFSNYGVAVKTLESRARDMLKIDDSKAIIATSSGSSALNCILNAICRKNEKSFRIASQVFTFPSNTQGAAAGPIYLDFNQNLDIDLENEFINFADIIIVTNCFGHLQNIDYILENIGEKLLIFDNAATPYSFWKGTNSCNIGTASYVSLHHTKPIGFGEGGLAIIDKEYEETARAAVNFGILHNEPVNSYGGNYKMSELSAAGILQWWDSFDIDELSNQYLDNYFDMRYQFASEKGDVFPHRAEEDEIFFPNCFPFIHMESTQKDDNEYHRKYYKPIASMGVADQVYDKIMCYGLVNNE